MDGEISYGDLDKSMFIPAVNSGILTWGAMGTDSLFEQASSDHSRICTLALDICTALL